jgi:hypothetical protein
MQIWLQVREYLLTAWTDLAAKIEKYLLAYVDAWQRFQKDFGLCKSIWKWDSYKVLVPYIPIGIS